MQRIGPGTRVVITGATGFVGRHLEVGLRRESSTVRRLVRRASDQRSEDVVGTLGDGEAIDRLVSEADVVYHLAGAAHRRPSDAAGLAEFATVNVEGTRTVARACLEHGARLVHISSSAVYGTAAQPWREDATRRPVTAYGESKARAEDIVRELMSRGLEARILRPSMVVGPGTRGSLPALARWVRRGVVPQLGNPAKSLVHVRHLVATLMAVGSRPELPETLNVADGHPATFAQIVDALATAANRNVLRVPVPGAARAANWAPAGVRSFLGAATQNAVMSTERLDGAGLSSSVSAIELIRRGEGL